MRFPFVLVRTGVALGLTLWSGSALAQVYLRSGDWWLPIGLSTGYAFHDEAPNAGLLGAEASFVRLTGNTIWYGGYADLLRDFGSDRYRVSIGPEFGYSFFGIDGGYVLEEGPGRLRHGIALRPLVTMGILSLGFRGVKTFGDGGDAIGELGILLKIPIPINL